MVLRARDGLSAVTGKICIFGHLGLVLNLLILELLCFLSFITFVLHSLCSNVQFQKIPYPPQRRLTEIPRGRGVSKDQFFKGNYDAKVKFPAGIGGQAKKPSVRGVWIFLEQHKTQKEPPENSLPEATL